jgi:hypothetical protein
MSKAPRRSEKSDAVSDAATAIAPRTTSRIDLGYR